MGRMEALTDSEIKAIERLALNIRRTIIEMLVAAGSGHTAGPLGMADVFAALYFRVLRHDPKNPDWKERDRLILSNGHIVPVRYAAMAHAGYFPVEECLTLRKFGSRMRHVWMKRNFAFFARCLMVNTIVAILGKRSCSQAQIVFII